MGKERYYVTESLDHYAAICKENLKALNIPIREAIVSPNGRIRSKWGYCKRISRESFRIEISKRLLEGDIPEKALLSVIYHELLHTCPGCMNHGKKWQEYGKVVKKSLGIKITQYGDADKMGVESHYYIKCRECRNKVWQPMKPRNDHKACPYCGSRKLSGFQKEKGEKIRLWKAK